MSGFPEVLLPASYRVLLADELHLIRAIDAEIYGERVVMLLNYTIEGMLSKFPKFILGAFDAKGRLVGYVAYMPISEATYNSIRSTCSELAITLDNTPVDKKDVFAWYSSSVYLDFEYRGAHTSTTLYKLHAILLKCDGYAVDTVLATAFSVDGEKALIHTGFTQEADAAMGCFTWHVPA